MSPKPATRAAFCTPHDIHLVYVNVMVLLLYIHRTYIHIQTSHRSSTECVWWWCKCTAIGIVCKLTGVSLHLPFRVAILFCCCCPTINTFLWNATIRSQWRSISFGDCQVPSHHRQQFNSFPPSLTLRLRCIGKMNVLFVHPSFP